MVHKLRMWLVVVWVVSCSSVGVFAWVHGCGLAVFIDQELCSMVRQQLRSIAAAGAPVSQATLMQKSNSPQPPLHALGVHCYRNGLVCTMHHCEPPQIVLITTTSACGAGSDCLLPSPARCVVVGAGNVEGGLDFANMLKPALARSQLQVIGATTLDEYRQHIETDPALTRRFQVRIAWQASAGCCDSQHMHTLPSWDLQYNRTELGLQLVPTEHTSHDDVSSYKLMPAQRLCRSQLQAAYFQLALTAIAMLSG